MARQKRHSRVEVATKLAHANDLARQGKLQTEIARTEVDPIGRTT